MSTTVRPLNPQLEEVARKELNEDPKRREQDLAHIKEWLKKQPHLNARTDDQWLLTFLRGCKFSLERTKEKLDTYYTMRTLLPEFFSNRDPMLPEIQEVLKLGLHTPLPLSDDKGRKVMLMRIGHADPSKMKINTSMKVNFMIMDILLMEDDEHVINGDVNLMDFDKVTVGHMVQMTPSVAKKMTTCFQDGYPVRPKSMNYVNFPSMFQTIFNLVNSFMKDKLKKRVHVHADFNSLYEQVPKRLLPKEYGGDAGTLDEITAEWKKKVESYRDWFLEEDKYKSNEKKRPGKPKTQENMFGLEGSFRQLSVD